MVEEGGSTEFKFQFASPPGQQEGQRVRSGGSPIRELPHAENSCRSSPLGPPREMQTPRSRRQIISHLKNPCKPPDTGYAMTEARPGKRRAAEVIQNLLGVNRNVRSNTQLHDAKADPEFNSEPGEQTMVALHSFA